VTSFSEFLAVERGGLKLYDEAVRIVTDPQVSKQFEVFRDQTRRHESILMQVMEQLGLDPAT
jgi:rubrerythrin